MSEECPEKEALTCAFNDSKLPVTLLSYKPFQLPIGSPVKYSPKDSMSMNEGFKVSMPNTGESLEESTPIVDGGKSNVRALDIEDRLDCPRLGPVSCISCI